MTRPRRSPDGAFAERPIGQTLLALVATLAAIPLVLQLITQWGERPYAIYLDANSEILTLTTTELSGTRWYLEDALLEDHVETATPDTGEAAQVETEPATPLIVVDLEAPPPPRFAFQGYLEIGPNARVVLTRRGAGALRIRVEAAPPGDAPDANQEASRAEAASPEKSANAYRLPAAVLEPLACDPGATRFFGTAQQAACVDDTADAKAPRVTDTLALDEATLTVTVGEPPLNGTLKGLGIIGGEPYQPTTPGSSPLLRQGEVAVVGRRLISEQIYTLMEVPLHLGDTVSVRGDAEAASQQAQRDDDSALFTCLFSIEGEALEGEGIELACHASGRSLAIGRYGDRSRDDLAPRPWDVLINEPSMQAILPMAITGLFVLLLRLLDGLYPRLCRRLSAGLARLEKRRSAN